MIGLRPAVIVCLLGNLACGNARPNVPAGSASAPGALPAGSMTHGDHNPRFGGVVLMNGQDLHFEVVLESNGRHRVYFSDAMRTALPASAATDVSIVIQRKGEEPERVPLEIDDRDESWVGQGHPLVGAGNITARISYTYHGQPYWIDLPFDAGQ